MAIIKISSELSGEISTFSQKIDYSFQENIDTLVKENNYFLMIFDKVNDILLKNDYVLIKNIGFNKNKALFESFIKLFGNFYGDSIEYANIKTDCTYTACSYNMIELHNDDMIALDMMPKYGFIQVLNEDPLKLAKNGLVKISEVVSWLKIYNLDLLNDLLTKEVPMLTYGVNYNDRDKQWILIKKTILYEDIDRNINVRFDIGTIKTYYWKNKKKQSIKEQKMIADFLSICKKFRKEFYLEAGDILIHNNKITLHDRTQTATELNIDGSLNTREIFVGFTKDYD